jgi:putative peptidoglycan lipid II flippase
MGEVFAVLCLGLVPYTMFQLQLRVFYAWHDSRTPALIGAAIMIINVAANYAALDLLSPGYIVAGLGLSFGVGNVLGSVLAWRLLGRRLGGLGGRAILRSLVRMHVAALPAAGLALAITAVAGAALPDGRRSALITVIVAGCAAVLLYLLLARRLRVSEVTELLATAAARLHRSS